MQVVRERQLEAVAVRHYEERAPGRLVRQWSNEAKNAKLQRLCVRGGGGRCGGVRRAATPVPH
jgi:hypothetical protein